MEHLPETSIKFVGSLPGVTHSLQVHPSGEVWVALNPGLSFPLAAKIQQGPERKLFLARYHPFQKTDRAGPGSETIYQT